MKMELQTGQDQALITFNARRKEVRIMGVLPESNFELAAAVVSSIEIDSGFATGYLPD
jgi:hypothetical protein